MITIDYDGLELNNCVVALGKFQGLHRGHMLLINRVVKLAKEMSVSGVCFSINMPGEKHINTEKEREYILESAGIDYKADCNFTKEFASMLPEDFVRSIIYDKLHASCVIVGEDFRFGKNRIGDVTMLKEFGLKYGFEVISFEKLSDNGTVIGSTLIRDLILQGDVAYANTLLGRDFFLSGEVTSGKKLGRKIGFPTINIRPSEDKLLPKSGVYMSHVILGGVNYKSVTNVGTNPTVDGVHGMFVETHIIDFSGDLYGENVTVYFDKFIRDEIKFDSVDNLTLQLNKDKDFVMHQ